MTISVLEQVTAALLQFTSETRLYELRLADDSVALMVEAFSADEGLQTIGYRDIIALSANALSS